MRRHPWIFSGALDGMPSVIQEGQIVKVLAHNNLFLGYAHFSTSGIALKMLSYEEQFNFSEILRTKLKAAIALRKSLGLWDSSDTNGFRLVHGEGDFLPGLIIDIYAATAVIQCHSRGMYEGRNLIANFLLELCAGKIQSVFNKSHEIGEGQSRFTTTAAYLAGEQQTNQFLENGLKFNLDWENGQKTGFFLDQRDNRQLIRQFSKNAKILNCFCYSGGFSVYAASTGANEVVSVDASKSALELTKANFELNNLSTAHTIVEADCLQYLKSICSDYDLIVLDPPAFIKHKGAISGGIKGYESINLHALQSIKSGGVLFTFSCSQLLGRQEFWDLLSRAALRAGRQVQLLKELQQAACHPSDIYHPEGRYLKGFVLLVT